MSANGDLMERVSSAVAAAVASPLYSAALTRVMTSDSGHVPGGFDPSKDQGRLLIFDG